MTRWLHASLVALSIAIISEHAGASTQGEPNERSARVSVECAPRPMLRDAWKKALVYLALLGAATCGCRLYGSYADELDGPM